MNKLIVTTLSLSVLAAPADAAPADAADGKKAVAALVRKAVNEVLTVLKNKEFSREDKRKKVSAIIDRLIDFRYMAYRSLGKKRWKQIKGQRTSFTALFTQTIRESYFEKIDLFTDETVEFDEPVAKENERFYLLTHILSKGERIKVAYRLYKDKEKAWKAFDLEIEGVSMVKLYKSQYRDFLRESSFKQLLAKMREKIGKARQKASRFGKEPEKTKKKETSN